MFHRHLFRVCVSIYRWFRRKSGYVFTMTDRIWTGGHGSSGSFRGRDAQPSILWVPSVQQNLNLGTKQALRPGKEINVPYGYKDEWAAVTKVHLQTTDLCLYCKIKFQPRSQHAN